MNRLKSFLACVLTLFLIGMTSMSALAEGEATTEVLDKRSAVSVRLPGI